MAWEGETEGRGGVLYFESLRWFEWLELAGFLILLGLIAEVVLRWQRTARPSTPVLVRHLG